MLRPLAVYPEEVACYKLTRYVFDGHQRLTSSHKQFIANYVTSYLAYSRKCRDSTFDRKQLALFLTYSYQQGLGRLALTFNDELDLAIGHYDTITLHRLLTGPKEMFVEVYDNSHLNSLDREYCLRSLGYEIHVFHSVLNSNIDDNVEQLLHACHDDVCSYDSALLQRDPIRTIMARNEVLPQNIHIVDETEQGQFAPYEFELIELLDSVTADPPINPQTQRRFSSYSLNLIQHRLHREIALYSRYRDNE